MRVLHVTTWFKRGGGAERNLLHWIDWQRAQGHDVELAVGKDHDRVEIQVPVRVIPSLRREPRPAADAVAFVALRKLLARGFDVVHTHESKAGVLGRLAAVRQTRAVVHSIHIPSFGPAHPPLLSAAFLTAERVCARVTDLYVAVGAEIADQYVAAGVGRRDQYSVIHSPIELKRFEAVRLVTDDARARLRRFFGVDSTRATLVSLGALELRKRHKLILERLAPMLRSGEAALIVAGEGPNHDALAWGARELGISDAVHLVGYCDDVPGLLAVADALVHASRAEGVPQVVVQAAAAGVPVVATDVPGLRELQSPAIAIAHSNGSDLVALVRTAVAQSRPTPRPAALDRWSPDAVAARIAAFEARVDALLASRVGAGRG